MRFPSSGGAFDCHSPSTRSPWKNASGNVGLVGSIQAMRSAAPAYPLSSRGNCFDDREMVSGIHESTFRLALTRSARILKRGCTRPGSLHPRMKTSRRLQPPMQGWGFQVLWGLEI
ncbi:unnamed protein product [Discosporangium mesarthrocarpum]